jgi:hypothetical protein
VDHSGNARVAPEIIQVSSELTLAIIYCRCACSIIQPGPECSVKRADFA